MEKEICKCTLYDMGHADSATEWMLADYQGDIKKILMQEARLLPIGKYAGGGAFEVAGAVEYTLLYADSENKLSSATFVSEYGFSMPIAEERFMSASPEVRINGFSMRLGGPRKISAKCSLSCRAFVSELDDVTVEGDSLGEDKSTQTLEENISVFSSFTSEGAEREFSEELGKINADNPDDVNVIVAGGSVKISEARAVEDGVLLVGTLELTAIVSTPDEPAVAISKSIPFEEKVTVLGASEGMMAVGDGILGSVSTVVNGEEDGVVSIGVNTSAEFYASTDFGEPVSLVTDAYNTDYESENEYREYFYNEHIASETLPISVSISSQKKDVVGSGVREILRAMPSVKLSSASLSAHSVDLSGEITVSGVACQENEDGKIEYTSFKFTSPIEQNVNLNCQIPENATVECKLVPYTAEVSFDSARLTAKCELGLTCVVTAKKCTRALEMSKLSKEKLEKKSGATVTVYFPDEGDTLWSIAKKYKTTVRDIAVLNSLSESVTASFDKSSGLSSVKKLLIK